MYPSVFSARDIFGIFPHEHITKKQGELDCKRIPTPGNLVEHLNPGASSGISKLNYITNLMTRTRDFRHHIFTQGWGIRPQFFLIV